MPTQTLPFRRALVSIAIAATCFLMSVPVFAQQDAGGITVAVTDQAAAVVPGAAVTLVNEGTNAHLKGVTDAIGVWTATPLSIGDYRVSVSKPGFATTVVAKVHVSAQQVVRVPVQLAIGQVSRQVVVTASSVAVQTVTDSLSQTISGTLKDNLPVVDRNFNRLATLTVGVNLSTPSGPRDTASGAFTANGITQYQNNYVLDGTDNNSYDQNINEGRTFAIEPSLDAIDEVNVITNTPDAEFGRDGGAVINVITKSGTNSFHGSAYEYFQSSDLNTNDFFNNAQNIKKQGYVQSIYGASAGGPVIIPRLYNGHNKTFFFADFERQPYRSPGFINKGVVPTPAEISGNFTGDQTIYDPLTGRPFPNNTIPAKRISSVSAKIASAIPSPNLTGSTFNYFNHGVLNTDNNFFAGRIDQQFTANDRVFVRYQYEHENQPQVGLFHGTILDGDDNVTDTAQGVVSNWVHLFSPRFISDARFGWTRLNWLGVPVYAGQNINSSVGIPNISLQGGLTGGLATITFSNNLSQFGGASSEQDLNGVYQVADTLTYNVGRHSIKLGGSYRHVSFLSAASSLAPNGGFSFDGHYTAGPGSTGDPFADFLLDLPNQSQLSAIHTDDYLRNAYALFIQDSVHVTQKLTVNAGLRYDYVTPVIEKHNHGAILNPYTHVLNVHDYTGSFPAAIVAQAQKGILSINRNANRSFGVQPDYKDFGPRFGFAYLLSRGTVWRAGYGLYYGPEQLGMYGQPSPGFSSPFLQEATYAPASDSPSVVNPVTMASGFPASAMTNPATPTLYATQLNLRTPYFQLWNTTFEHQLSNQSVFDISYIGSKTTALYTTMDWNIPALEPNNDIPYAERQPFPNVDANGNLIPGAAIQGPSNKGMGTYNALGAKYNVQMQNGLSMISAFTWSHDIDDITNDGLSVGNNGRGNYPYNQLKGQRGNSDWDVADRWVTAFEYQLPYGRGRAFGGGINRAANALLGDWQIGGIFTWNSGSWYTVAQQVDSANVGFKAFCGTCQWRPDVVAGEDANSGPRKVNPNNPSVHWFNINAFKLARNGTIGNVGRNTVLGPAYRDFDATLAKVFPFGEGASLQVRAEAYNLTNTTNFMVGSGTTSPSGFYLGNSNFGDLTADRGGRVVQLVGRFTF